MAAAFTHAAVYAADAVCLSPLRTGNAWNDPDEILSRSDGTAFVQGTSLAGALRGWLEGSRLPGKAGLTKALFGSQDAGGHLTVSDAVFERNALPSVRARLAIDPETGAGRNGAKFELAQINAGAKMRFTLVWMGTDTAELPAIEKMLSALNAGEILLGAQKTNGFGRVSVKVKKRVLNLRGKEDRELWLAWSSNGALPGSEPLALPEPEKRPAVTFTVKARCDSLLVKASEMKSTGAGKSIKYYAPNLTENQMPVLPGSSVKGAVRARAAAIAQYLGLEASFVEELFGRGSDKAEGGRSGRDDDNGLPGRVRFEDARLCPEGQRARRISRIHIDRFTGGVTRSGPFTEEPLHVENITLRITAPAEDAACGLLLYALRDLGLGLYSLGSGQAIGRGYFRVERIEAVERGAEGKPAALRFSQDAPERGIAVAMEDPAGIFDRWNKALKEAAKHED